MGIIYALSIIILFVGYLLIQKTKNKIDILKQIVLAFVMLLCYNTFICYILTFVTIPITLLGLSIINGIISAIIIAYLVKTKKIQSYKFNKIDMLYIFLLAIVVIIMANINFGFPFEIKYETGDPSVHYLTSQMFAEGDGLLAAEKSDPVYGNFNARKTASYVNSGLIMKCFDGIIDPFYNYNIFIIFGTITLFLTAWMFYSTIGAFVKSNITRFIAFIVTLLYTMGYPLNSYLFGFEYFSLGLLILNAIIASVDIYQKEEISFKNNLFVFFLLNFGLFTAYYMLVPYTYSALWIYFCYTEYKKQKKLITLKTAILLLVTLLIPFGLGYIYHIAPDIYAVFIKDSATVENAIKYQNHLVNEGLSVDGYIYVNLYSNMLLLLPFSVIAIFKGWKENKAVALMTIFDIGFIGILLLGNYFEKVSIYYLSKNYFALWLFLWYLTFKGMMYLEQKDRLIPIVSVAGYTLIVILHLLFGKTEIAHGEINPNERISRVADIYLANEIILKKPKDLTTEELEILKYVIDNIPEDKKTEIAGDPEQVYWSYVMLQRINDDEPKRYGQNKLTWKTVFVGERAGKVEYVVYFNRGYFYKYWKEELWENAEMVYENEAGGILQYKM